MEHNFNNHHGKKIYYARAVTVIVMGMLLVLIATGVLYFSMKKAEEGIKSTQESSIYEKHYVLITDDMDDPLWESAYEGALEQGGINHVYIEYLGRNLPVTYTVEELLRIAIDASVDGIIVVGDESEERTELINEAVSEDIAVVTLLSDCTASMRQCFVGINSYNLGQEYGRQALQLLRDTTGQKVCVLMDSSSADTSKNTTFLGIKETIEAKYGDSGSVEVQALAVNGKNSFVSEEMIRDIMIDEENLPDVLICLNAVDTRCAYQAAVDYNKVGVVEILGYYDSEMILSAVEKSVIYSTISIDGAQMGKLCMNALQEYAETGYVSGYFPVDTKLIDSSNVDYYLSRFEETGEEAAE